MHTYFAPPRSHVGYLSVHEREEIPVGPWRLVSWGWCGVVVGGRDGLDEVEDFRARSGRFPRCRRPGIPGRGARRAGPRTAVHRLPASLLRASPLTRNTVHSSIGTAPSEV